MWSDAFRALEHIIIVLLINKSSRKVSDTEFHWYLKQRRYQDSNMDLRWLVHNAQYTLLVEDTHDPLICAESNCFHCREDVLSYYLTNQPSQRRFTKAQARLACKGEWEMATRRGLQPFTPNMI